MTTYDVFLSHATDDKPAVEALARRLHGDGLEPFLDKWHLVPGKPWQEALKVALTTSRACAVFVGRELGPWQNVEMRAVLDRRVRDEDFSVVPVLLPGADKPADHDLPLFLRGLTWVDLRDGPDDDGYHRLVCGISGTPPGDPAPGDTAAATAASTATAATAAAYRAKLPPRDFFVRRRELDEVRDLLVSNAGSTVGITTALRGAGGFGKTALARALCDEPDVRRAYPDGILWTTMGENLGDAERIDRALDLVRWWSDKDPPGFKSARDAGDYLKQVLAGRRVLLVVDDVWHTADLEPFRGLEPGTVLATTRNVRTLPAETLHIDVDAMARSEAVELLARGLPPGEEERLGALAARLGEWPLLLRLVGAQLRRSVHQRGLVVAAAMHEADSLLTRVGLRAFDQRDATERGEAASLTMQLSLDALSSADRCRFLDLAVFPDDVDIPIRVLERYWQLDDWQAETLCEQLDDGSLLVDLAPDTIRLHDVVRQYLAGAHPSLPAAHRRLVESCRPPGGRWSDLAASETYLWRHLAGHLAGAGEQDELGRLLFDFEYLESKVRTVGVNALLADYDVLGEAGDARNVQEALRLSAHVLSRDWGGLLGQLMAGQLLGRSGKLGEEGRRLMQGASTRTPLRPRRVRMIRPGGPLVRTLEGHIAEVTAVARLDDQRVVSTSSDHTLRVWDLDSGKTLAVFALDAAAISVAVTAAGRGIVAGDALGGVHFLDLDLSC